MRAFGSTAIVLLLVGSAISGAEGAGGEPAHNLYLASNLYAVDGFDPAQTRAFVSSVPPGTFRPKLREAKRIPGGPINLMTYASNSPSRLWALSSQRVAYVDLTVTDFTELARLDLGTAALPTERLDALLGQTFPGLPQLEEALRREWGLDDRTWPALLQAGTCGLVDIDNVLYVNGGPGGATVLAIGVVPGKPPQLKVLRRRDLSGVLPTARGTAGPAIVGLNLTYDGKLVVVGQKNVVVLERILVGPTSVVSFGDDETVSHGAAIDPKGGIYVVSDTLMHKLVWNRYRLSDKGADGAWSAPYDTGRQPSTLKKGPGSGSTPALMGFEKSQDELVVITDGADQMKLVAFWRDRIPQWFRQRAGARSLRVAGQIPVTCGLSPLPEFIQSRQSVVVLGYGAFVVNNVRAQGSDNRLVDVLAEGPLFVPAAGAERFEWNPEDNLWGSVWTRPDLVSMGMAPSVSTLSNTVLVHGYTKKDGREVTGLDWADGRTVHRTILGQDLLGNGGYGALQFVGKDDLLFNSIGGPMRLPLVRPEAR